ncbi:MAG: chorismate mutase [Acidobacteria bacterium]|nr:MAG: chorismate mutase [Acidobacteriota bacterium]
MATTDLNKFRSDIDSIDKQLVELFNQRAKIVLEIGRYKQQNHMAVYEPKREAVVFANVASHNNGPLPDEELATIYTAILAAMRRLQSPDILERS